MEVKLIEKSICISYDLILQEHGVRLCFYLLLAFVSAPKTMKNGKAGIK